MLHKITCQYKVTYVIGQTQVHLTLADAGIELISIPASGPTVNDPFPFWLRFEVYNLTLDAG